MTEIRCGNCNYWLGEASAVLVFVEHVDKSTEARVVSPRDLRVCKSCGRVNVFVAKSTIDRLLARV